MDYEFNDSPLTATEVSGVFDLNGTYGVIDSPYDVDFYKLTLSEASVLSKVIKEVLKIDIDALPDEAKNFPILSGKFGVEPSQMITFLEMVEDTFKIKVLEAAIAERRFNTFNDIVEIIISQKGEL